MALLYVAERSMVFHTASFSAKGFWLKLHCHKHLRWDLVFAVNTEARSRREAKSGVILGMPQNNNFNKAQLLALLKTCSNKCRTDTFALMLRYYRHGGEPHYFEAGMPRQKNRRKHDVTDNCPVVLSDGRNNR